MPKLRFNSATITGLVLAKVGNPQRDEPLQTSREIFRVDQADRETLSALFLKPFKNLMPHRFFHHSSLTKNEVNQCAKAIFSAPGRLLESGLDIARRLYSKSTHPNIKSGDLCVALMDDIEIDGTLVNALCLLKSECIVPFLSISTEDGDLKLHTEQGINPEKIDKGCLILNHTPDTGYFVLTFDRGGEVRFWNREFLGLQAVPDAAFLTHTFADMAVNAVKHQLDESILPEESSAAAREVIAYFDERENFDLQEFEEQVLKSPDAVARFADARAKAEEDHGQPLETNFEISPKEVKKTRKLAATVLKLDTGVEVHIKPGGAAEPVLERGFDDKKGMKFIKIFFNEDLTAV